MTKNPNPGLFSPFCFCKVVGAGLGRARGGVGKGVGAIIFICDPLYQPYTHYVTFSWRYSIGQCTRTALEIFQRDVTPKQMSENTHRAHKRLLKEYLYNVLLRYLQWLGSKCHFLNFTHYKCIETPRCHSNHTRELIFINNTKSIKANLMNSSIKSHFHRVYGF